MFKERNEIDQLAEIKNLLNNVAEIIIIGFSFDEDNLCQIGLPAIGDWVGFLRDRAMVVKWLNYKNDMTAVSQGFKRLADLPALRNTFKIRESTRSSIVDAYQYDFKIF